jgi:glycosyltransferase involved in cell wall biosynthesis
VSFQRTRIAHFLKWSSVGGTEIATLRLMQGLPEFTHLAFLAVQPSPASALFAGAAFPVHAYESAELSLRWPLPHLLSSVRLARLLRRARVSVVHCSDVVATLDAALGARLARLPVICHVRNPHEHLPARGRPILRLVSHFVFVSQHARERLGMAIPAEHASVVYDGLRATRVDHAEARKAIGAELKLAPETRLVGMVARLAPQKDYPTFVRAARRILAGHPDTHFLIVGDHAGDADLARHHAQLSDLIATLGMSASFTFTGFRSDTETLLAAMDVAVLATHYEGFGLSLLEAMAQERPVVATRVGGIPEFVVHGVTGLLHAHEDDADLAAQVLSLLGDPGQAARIARAGRELVERRFTMDGFARRMGDLYRALARP